MSSTDVPRSVVFWSGAVAGMVSATSTHFLDVGKVAKQVGRVTPSGFCTSYWMRGLPVGALAQGQRFATTLVLDSTLQQKLKDFRKKGENRNDLSTRVLSFSLSMFSSGLGELMANPPVAVKNYQIAHDVPCARKAASAMYQEKQVVTFFRGVTAGVIRKSLANAIVLQSISPSKQCLSSLLSLDKDNKKHAALSGFLAGGLTGGVAEVLTNPPDRVKTMMQADPRMRLKDAIKEAVCRPFVGAGYAFVRKGAIRAINWGVVGVVMAVYQTYTPPVGHSALHEVRRGKETYPA